MNCSTRDFIKLCAGGAAAVATSACATRDCCRGETGERSQLKVLPPVMPNLQLRQAKTSGKVACKYVDDCIWFLRDIALARPKSIFDQPFLGGFKKIHEETGLKVQFNLFYRTDSFYDMNEFTLAQMPNAYKAEFQANADWIRFGLHALQEFPDYPWVNSSYEDVAKCLKMIHGEVARFAGDSIFARALLPHWVPMSKDGVRACADGGIKMIYPTSGTRYAYNDDPAILPYGHHFRLVCNRKPETALWSRGNYLKELEGLAICGYNHFSPEQKSAQYGKNVYFHDPDTGMNFRDFLTDPMTCLNVHSMERTKDDLEAVKDVEFVAYGNHEQYFYKDYFLCQPEYMVKEMMVAKTLAARGYRFVFMEEQV